MVYAIIDLISSAVFALLFAWLFSGLLWEQERQTILPDQSVYGVSVRNVQCGGHSRHSVSYLGSFGQSDSLRGRKELPLLLSDRDECGDVPALRVPAPRPLAIMQELENNHPGGLRHLCSD